MCCWLGTCVGTGSCEPAILHVGRSYPVCVVPATCNHAVGCLSICSHLTCSKLGHHLLPSCNVVRLVGCAGGGGPGVGGAAAASVYLHVLLHLPPGNALWHLLRCCRGGVLVAERLRLPSGRSATHQIDHGYRWAAACPWAVAWQLGGTYANGCSRNIMVIHCVHRLLP